MVSNTLGMKIIQPQFTYKHQIIKFDLQNYLNCVINNTYFRFTKYFMKFQIVLLLSS